MKTCICVEGCSLLMVKKSHEYTKTTLELLSVSKMYLKHEVYYHLINPTK